MAAVSVKFLGDITQLRRAIDTAKGEAAGMGSKFKGALGSMKLPALAAGAALFKLAQDAGATADALFDMQDQTGISTDKLQEMRYVADQAGVAQDFYADAVKEVIKANDRIARGTGPAAEALEAMGIAAKNADGSMRGAEEITDEVIQGLLGIEDASRRAALAEDIFKRKSDQLLPVLGLGEEALAGMRQEAHELGVVQSGEALEAANEYRQNMEKLQAALQHLVNALMESLLPAVTDYVIPALIWLAEKAGDVEHAVESFGDVIFGTMDEIAAAANAAPKSFDGFTAKLKEVDEQARVTGGGVRSVAEAVQMTADEMRKATDPAFALRKANEEYKEAQQAVAALQASGRTNTAEYQDAVAGLLEEQADLNYATAQYEEAGGAAAEGLFELGEQARITREEVEALIFAMENLNRTPISIDAQVDLSEVYRDLEIFKSGARRPL
jgi:hypothetical protein